MWDAKQEGPEPLGYCQIALSEIVDETVPGEIRACDCDSSGTVEDSTIFYIVDWELDTSAFLKRPEHQGGSRSLARSPERKSSSKKRAPGVVVAQPDPELAYGAVLRPLPILY